MNCKECRNLMVIRIYGRMESAEEEELQTHVRGCGECRLMYTRFEEHTSILAGADPETLPDWEASWRTIAGGAFPEGKPGRVGWSIPRPLLAAATLVLVFILGALAGRQLLFRGSHAASPEMLALQGSGLALERYADDLDPILTGFMNRTAASDVEEASRLAQIERLLIQDMLIQTRLLKHLMGQTDDPALPEFLDDLELILVGMANLQSGDEESLSQLQEIIREKGLKLKLRAFIRAESTL
jgi:hypothetical protein